MPTEVFFAAGTAITVSNKNRLASRMDADRCNHRTSINATVIGAGRCAAVGDCSVGVSVTQSNSNVKFPVVTWVSTETARHTTLYLPGFSSGSETASKAPFD